MGTFDGVYSEVYAERKRQDEHWGWAHDASHDTWEWYQILYDRLQMMLRAGSKPDQSEVRRRLVQTAAVAVAAVESMDWRTA